MKKIKKIKIQNRILYISNVILIGYILLSNKGIILDNNKILKNMDESIQVSDLNKSINQLEASHEEYQNYIQTKKTNLATAITNAGIETDSNADFETMITNVSNIIPNKTGDATATASGILNGQTAYVNGEKITGTMPIYTSGSQEITTTGKWGLDTTYGAWSYIPNNGYYSTGHWTNIPWNTIKGSLGDTTAANVLAGQTFSSSSGLKQTGTMTNRGAWTNTPTGSENVTIPEGYHNGSGYVNTSTVYTNGYNEGKKAGDVKNTIKYQVFGESGGGWYYRTWINGVYQGESGWHSGDIILSTTL